MLRNRPSIVPVGQLGRAVSHGVSLAIQERAAAAGLPGNSLDPFAAAFSYSAEMPGTTTGIFPTDPTLDP